MKRAVVNYHSPTTGSQHWLLHVFAQVQLQLHSHIHIHSCTNETHSLAPLQDLIPTDGSHKMYICVNFKQSDGLNWGSVMSQNLAKQPVY